jgi:hypothetical protein
LFPQRGPSRSLTAISMSLTYKKFHKSFISRK